MGLKTIVVLDNGHYGDLEKQKNEVFDRLLSLMRRGDIGRFGPGAHVVAVQHHSDESFFYFDGETLRIARDTGMDDPNVRIVEIPTT